MTNTPKRLTGPTPPIPEKLFETVAGIFAAARLGVPFDGLYRFAIDSVDRERVQQVLDTVWREWTTNRTPDPKDRDFERDVIDPFKRDREPRNGDDKSKGNDDDE